MSFGGGVNIPQQKPYKEYQVAQNLYGKQANQYLSFIGQDPLLSGAYSGIEANMLPILESGGMLSPAETRQVQQSTRAAEAARGMATSPGSVTEEVKNLNQAMDQRFQMALGNTLGTESQGISSFGALSNPILNFLGNLYGQNQNAAQAAATANANKEAGLGAGALKAAGSIAGSQGNSSGSSAGSNKGSSSDTSQAISAAELALMFA